MSDGPNTGTKYLLWSNKHDAWWGPDDQGYTPDVRDAGRYDKDAAVDRALNSAEAGERDWVSYPVAAPDDLRQAP